MPADKEVMKVVQTLIDHSIGDNAQGVTENTLMRGIWSLSASEISTLGSFFEFGMAYTAKVAAMKDLPVHISGYLAMDAVLGKNVNHADDQSLTDGEI